MLGSRFTKPLIFRDGLQKTHVCSLLDSRACVYDVNARLPGYDHSR